MWTLVNIRFCHAEPFEFLRQKNQEFMFVCNREDTIQYQGGLRSRELGQAPMLLVFLLTLGLQVQLIEGQQSAGVGVKISWVKQ